MFFNREDGHIQLCCMDDSHICAAIVGKTRSLKEKSSSSSSRYFLGKGKRKPQTQLKCERKEEKVELVTKVGRNSVRNLEYYIT